MTMNAITKEKLACNVVDGLAGNSCHLLGTHGKTKTLSHFIPQFSKWTFGSKLL